MDRNIVSLESQLAWKQADAINIEEIVEKLENKIKIINQQIENHYVKSGSLEPRSDSESEKIESLKEEVIILKTSLKSKKDELESLKFIINELEKQKILGKTIYMIPHNILLQNFL